MWRVYIDGVDGKLLEFQNLDPRSELTPIAAAAKFIQSVRAAGGTWNHNIRAASGGAAGWYPFHSIRVFRVEEVT